MNRFTVVALPADTQLQEFEIIEGRNLAPGDTDAIVVNNALAGREAKMRVGETVVLRMGPAETTWRVVGFGKGGVFSGGGLHSAEFYSTTSSGNGE